MRIAPVAMAGLLLWQVPAVASSYDALCGDTACTITLDASGLSSPAGFLPTHRIAQWFTGGEESYNVGSGTAGALGGATAGAIGGAILLGPIGLLGGLVGGGIAGSKAGKSADLFFNVIGYDESGQKVTVSFRFVNPKPANRMKQELPMFTGLAMGQIRSLDVIRQSITEPAANPMLPEQLSPAERGAEPASPAPQTLPESLDPQASPQVGSQTSGTAAQSWDDYLRQRGLEEWAQTNPALAEQLRRRLFPAP